MNSTTFKLSAIALGILFTGNSYAASTTLVSSVSGNSVQQTSQHPSINHNGQYVTFISKSGALVGDSSNTQHVYIKDLVKNSIQRASVSNTGTNANNRSFNPKISGDGNFVVFHTKATNLGGSDSNNTHDIYRYNTQKGTSTLVSNKLNTTATGNAKSAAPSISVDGRYVAFESAASDLVSVDNNGKRQIYVKDMQTGETEIISIHSNGKTIGNNDSFSPSISGNGRFVVFSSISDNLGDSASNGIYDIYLHDRQNKITERISYAINNNGLSNGLSSNASISDDGEIIAYSSEANNLVNNDSNGLFDIFIYDRTNQETTRISNTTAEPNGLSVNPQISGNGRLVSFSSAATNLVGSDTNGSTDLFVYDRLLKTITLASLGNSSNIGKVFGINFDGTFNVFSTSSILASQDANTKIDVYLRKLDPPPNSKPIANVVNIPSEACVNGGATVTFDASNSTDLDKDNLTYSWSGDFSTVSGKIVDVILGAGNHNVTLTVTDSHGDSDSQSFSINITDTTAPVVNAATPVTLEASSINGAKHTVSFTATDNCEIAGTNESPTLSTYPLGSTNVTITATDTLGNNASDQTSVTVQDTTAPVLTLPVNITKEANANRTAVAIGTATASDIFPVTVTSNAPADYSLGQTQVTWSAKDSNKNISSGKQSVTIRDTTSPTLTIPSDKTVEALAPTMTVNIGKASASDIFLNNVKNNAPTKFPMGSTPVLWTASDNSGNATSATQTIQVLDTIPPELNSDVNIILEATSKEGAQYVIQYSATDGCINCGPIDFTFNPVLDFYPLGETIVQLTARDSSNNSTTNDVNITVQDTTPPTLDIPADIKTEATAVLSVVDINNAAGGDIFTPVRIDNNAPDAFPLGTTAVIWSATDDNGQVTTETQQITVVDTTAPVLTTPANLTVEAQARLTTVDIGKASATDIFSVEITNDAPAHYSLGDTIVAWTVIDSSGNKTTANQTITVVDTTAPALTIPANLTIEAQASLTTVNIGQASATDIYDFEITNNALANYALGDTTITWTVIDVNGNKSIATQTITIVDTTAPTVSAGSDMILEATSQAGVPFTLAYQASDICDCGELAINITPLQSHYALGDTLITISATDISGNTASDTMRLSVVDTTKPTLTAPANILLEATGPLTPVFPGNATANDIFNVSIVHNAPPVFPLGTSVITWTATDSNGNITTALQMVSIVDTTAPLFTLDIEKNKLWPANHKMIHVGNVEKISDLVDANPVVNIEISSNADHQRKKHKPDWKIVDAGEEWKIYLRAEKSKHAKEDRIYTINVTVSDFTGNQSQQTSEVIVPHNHKKHNDKQDEHEEREEKHKKSKDNNRDHKKHTDDND